MGEKQATTTGRRSKTFAKPFDRALSLIAAIIVVAIIMVRQILICRHSALHRMLVPCRTFF
jgi:hypothetical protein